MLVLTPRPAIAQAVRSRILRNLSIHDRGERWVVRVGFTNPVRYLRHSPKRRGRDLHVQIENIAVSRIDALPALMRETLIPPPGSGVPIEEVIYDGNGGDIPSLDVRFSRTVTFEVKQGEDFRSITIAIEKTAEESTHESHRPPSGTDAPSRHEDVSNQVGETEGTRTGVSEIVVDLRAPYAVQLYARPEAEPLPEVPELEVFRHHRLYVVSFVQEASIWRRLRLGFFATADEARAAMAELEAFFPEAFVVKTGRGERVASYAHAIWPFKEHPAPQSRGARLPATAEVEAIARETAPLLEKGREAMTAGQLDLAVSYFTKLLSYPEHPVTREAKELLGLARERNGQLAHAKAEYEEYLARYPEGEGAERVRQRLRAMLTARSTEGEPLRPARSRAGGWDTSLWGSLSTSYLRSEPIVTEVEGVEPVSSSYSDLLLSGRWSREDLSLMGRFAGDQRYDVTDRELALRVSSLFLDVDERGLGVEVSVGRQSANTAGVLGRFDGGRLGWTFGSGWTLAGVVGFPVDFDRRFRVDTSKRFAGVSLDTPTLFDGLQGQIYAIGQLYDGFVDRAAVGTELRYAAARGYAVALADYDLHYDSLNTAYFLGNWHAGVDTDVNLTLDYRNSPLLTTANALQGQLVDSLSDLRDSFTRAQIEALAVDRTARSETAMLGITHRLTERSQIAGDFGIADFGGTKASGGIEAVDGTGLEYSYGVQFIANDLFLPDDVGIFGLRAHNGGFSDSYGCQINLRLPVTEGIRLNPRLAFDYRDVKQGSNLYSVRPALRFEWRIWRLYLYADGGLEWIHRSSGLDRGDEVGYLAEVSARVDFD